MWKSPPGRSKSPHGLSMYPGKVQPSRDFALCLCVSAGNKNPFRATSLCASASLRETKSPFARLRSVPLRLCGKQNPFRATSLCASASLRETKSPPDAAPDRKNKKTERQAAQSKGWCSRRDSNPQSETRPAPQAGVSANSTTRARGWITGRRIANGHSRGKRKIPFPAFFEYFPLSER